MTVSFEGIGETVCTFYNDSTSPVENGYPVKMKSNATVGDCSENDSFIGVALDSSEAFASVVVSGVVTLPYLGTAPTVGYTRLCADGSGNVKVGSTTGREYLVLEVDTTNASVTFVL